MKQVHVSILNYLDKIANLEEVMPKEFAVVTKWKEQGILEHLFIKEDRTGAFLVFKNVDAEKTKELISTLPMFKYFEKVDYLTIEKQF